MKSRKEKATPARKAGDSDGPKSRGSEGKDAKEREREPKVPPRRIDPQIERAESEGMVMDSAKVSGC